MNHICSWALIFALLSISAPRAAVAAERRLGPALQSAAPAAAAMDVQVPIREKASIALVALHAAGRQSPRARAEH